MPAVPALGPSVTIRVRRLGKEYVGNYRRRGLTLWVFHRLACRTVLLDSPDAAETVACRLVLEMAQHAAADRGRSTYDYSVQP